MIDKKKIGDMINRGIAIDAMMQTKGWKILEEDILNEIRRNGSIRNITQNDIERSYWKRYLKVDIYEGLLLKTKRWVDEGNKLEKKEAKNA